MSIARFIELNLKKLNSEHFVKVLTDEAAGVDRIRKTMEDHNSLITNQLGFEEVELTPEQLAQMKITVPDAFKKPKKIFEATANYYWGDGKLAKETKFAVEVIM